MKQPGIHNIKCVNWEMHKDGYHMDLEEAQKTEGKHGRAQWPDDTGTNEI